MPPFLVVPHRMFHLKLQSNVVSELQVTHGLQLTQQLMYAEKVLNDVHIKNLVVHDGKYNSF